MSVHDVAAYILEKCGPMATTKLHKLAYYCQAWSLVWDDRPLFRGRIVARASGPVVPKLYKRHRGRFHLDSWRGDPGKITGEAKKTVDAVLRCYGGKKSFWLSQLAQAEDPWRGAYRGMAPGDGGETEITHAAMAEYYASLDVRVDIEAGAGEVTP